MILDKLLSNEGKVTQLLRAIIDLHEVDLFSALIDHATTFQALKKPGTESILEETSLKYSWIEGYCAALRDISHFEDLFVKKVQRAKQPAADFGALRTMLNSGNLTQEEYDNLVAGGSG